MSSSKPITPNELTLPDALETIFAVNQSPDHLLSALMPALCQVLKCDRCFLYVRDPHHQKGRITHCYSRDPRGDLAGSSWLEEGDALKDPLMAIAFRTSAAVFVEDIETAGSEVVDLDYEREKFQHRALIHAPIYQDGLLLGILEPCMFETPRDWTVFDQQVIREIQERLSGPVLMYLEQMDL